MTNKLLSVVSILLLPFCCTSVKQQESEQLVDAKWYYYSYSNRLSCYNRKVEAIHPLTCEISLRSVKKAGDTTAYYFESFFKDSLNWCTLKPYGLVGINVVRDSIYLPIYRHVNFLNFTEAQAMEEMHINEGILQAEIVENRKSLNQWLLQEALKRKIL